MHQEGPGRPGWGPPFGWRPFGPGGWPGFGPPFGRRFGGRARRGDVRAAILALLVERPMHGYEIIQELEQRSDGWWRPSPGSVYPTLQLLEDEGLVVAQSDGTKRRFALSEAGATEAAEVRARPEMPWEEVSAGAAPGSAALRQATGELVGAIFQVARTGRAALQGEAEQILTEARRRLYALLARDE